MTDAQYTTLPQWPHAYPASNANATLKLLNEDFVVTELPLQLPSGEGEHIWLDIEKNGANTAYVAQQLAEAAQVMEAQASQLANVTYTHPNEDGSVSQETDPATLAQEVPKVGRNDPCPCGSGKKYKACHGRLA